MVIHDLYAPSCGVSHKVETFDIHNRKDFILSDDFIRSVFEDKKPKGELDQDLYLETTKRLQQGLDKSFGLDFAYDTPDNVLRNYLRHNVFRFSMAKNLTMIEDIRAALLDENGKPRAFSAFKHEVVKINEAYNVNWLRAEYQHAIAQGQHASNWLQYERDKDLYPNLRYQTIEDDRVRPEHASLNGVVKPVDDPFWNTYAPQNGWGCRCSLLQVDDEVIPTESEEAKQRGKAAKVKKGFAYNAGKQGVVYDDNHPYLVNNGKKEAVSALQYGLKALPAIYKSPKQLNQLKNTIANKEDYKKWWASQVKSKGTGAANEFVLNSKVLSTKILLDDELFKRPFVVKRQGQNAHLFADELALLLNDPNEVYSIRVNADSGRTQHEIQTIFIRYYQGKILVAIMETIKHKNVVRLVDWYPLDPTNKNAARLRKGILQYNKTL